MTPTAAEFIQALLDDWEADEHQVFSEFGAGADELQGMVDAIAARRAEGVAVIVAVAQVAYMRDDALRAELRVDTRLQAMRAENQRLRDALQQIANEDYRGIRPASAFLAEKALRGG